MAQTAPEPAPLTNPYAPVSLEARDAEKRWYREQQAAARGRMLDCLDPTIAKSYEEKKPLYEWNVKCRIFRPARGRLHAHMENFDKDVVAQTENDAWSLFCDSIGEYPSPRDSSVKITRLKKRALRDSVED